MGEEKFRVFPIKGISPPNIIHFHSEMWRIWRGGEGPKPWDNRITHPSILPQQPSPLDIVVVQPPCFLGKHQFIISKPTICYSDTIYVNP